MRKVFLWNIILRDVDTTKYVSDDFQLEGMEFNYWMSYLINMNIEENDNIAVITSYTAGGSAENNYKEFQKEVMDIAAEKNVKVDFISVVQDVDFCATTFNKFFKKIARLIKDDDRLYFDITFGMKPYTLSMFTALLYVSKVAKNVYVEVITYAQKYDGIKAVDQVKESKIFNMTALFYLNSIAGNLSEGDRETADKMLDILLR